MITPYPYIYREGCMPTRRTLELVILGVLLLQPVFGAMKVWSVKTLNNTSEGSVLHGVAEIGSVIL